MKLVITLITVIILLIAARGFENIESEDYVTMEPKFDIKEYFNGNIKAYGVIHGWTGKVIEKFDVDMVGKWEGNTGTLTEDFTYYDGKKIHRQWTIHKISETSFEATAPDVKGKAEGKVIGNAIGWNYKMYLPPDKKKFLVKIKDWMWMMNDGVVIDKIYLSKFGIPLGQLSITMIKAKH